MSVRQSLLAILDQGPCYGYQLRAEFDRRTGSTWPLNVGQIYNTLERLERDGLVAKGEVDAAGHVYYQITDAGRDDVRAWLAAPVERATGTRDELTIKLALAATLPGADVAAIVHDQRVASRAALERLREEQDAAPAAETPAAAQPGAQPDGGELARRLVTEAMALQMEAELRWLDQVEAALGGHAPHALALHISADKPRRGRPPRLPDAGSGVTEPAMPLLRG